MTTKKSDVKKADSVKESPKDSSAHIRKYRAIGLRRVGMLFSGGPAPAANAVISAAAIQFLNAGYEVIGFYKGYEHLENFDKNNPRKLTQDEHYRNLSLDDVTRIRQLGGSVLKTARANPSKFGGNEIKCMADLADPVKTKKLNNVLDAFEYLGIGALISIGGDDTLKTAYYLNKLGLPVVHVPKTIDNDYYGIPWTFGYFSAIERARQDIKVYNVEACTTECYFVIELMGRKAGWYTLGAGIAGEAVRMIGPEEVGDKLDMDKLLDGLTEMMHRRSQNKKPYGVILVSEGLADKLPEEYLPKSKTIDEHGNVKLSDARVGEIIGNLLARKYYETTKEEVKIKTETIGYTTRCVEPNAFDILLGSQLGMGAFKAAKEDNFGNMVSVGDNLEIKFVPFEDLIDKKTFKTRVRLVPKEGDFYKLAQSLEFRAMDES